MNESIRKEILEFIERTKTIMISAINSENIPIVKGVTKLGNDGMEALYFCTSQESEFFKYYSGHPIVSVYLLDDDAAVKYPSADEKYYALSLIGRMEKVLDQETKRRFLSDYLSAFFPDGIEDPNYNLVKFAAQKGKYYRGVTDHFLSLDFELDTLERV
ncbi:MAG TPA: pyridoxamine 5'-phosphate oxidase family protein [Clostridia bacterium]|nr:pyridoxamine 5'-phosphate oxidase family protein [Clostridia bacterium]